VPMSRRLTKKLLELVELTGIEARDLMNAIFMASGLSTNPGRSLASTPRRHDSECLISPNALDTKRKPSGFNNRRTAPAPVSRPRATAVGSLVRSS
jgi:hypothetical protein